MINRSALTVMAKQPFLNWLRNLPNPVAKSTTLDAINKDPTVYLMPEYDNDEQREFLIKKGFGLIFDEELRGWWEDEADWPSERKFKDFKKWFDVNYFSVVQDLSSDPLLDE